MEEKRKKASVAKILIVVFVLTSPSALYLFLGSCNQYFTPLPVLGPREVNEKGDTVYHTVRDFSFTDQQGRTVTHEDFNGHIYVTNFFFTSCPSICPKMTEQMQRIQEKFRNDTTLKLLSHTVDPARDSVSVLAEYASKAGADPGRWHFVTGHKQEIYEIAGDYFLFASDTGGEPSHRGFIHSPMLVLVDKEKRIRAFCEDGTNYFEVDTLIGDIKNLLFEYNRPKKEKKKEE